MKTKIARVDSVQIVADAAIAVPDVGDGRLIPYLILGCDRRPDIADLIMAHQDQPPGDVVSVWAIARFDHDQIFLHLSFKRPTPGEFYIRFDLHKHGMLIDGIIQSNAAYLQADTVATSAADGIDKPKILIEVPDGGEPFDWEKLLERHVRKRFKKEGLKRADAAQSAKRAIEMSRQFWRLRKRI